MTKMFENAIKNACPENPHISSVIPTAYDMTLEDSADLMELAKTNPFWAIHYAFVFGFVMGNRATITRKLKRL